MICVGGTFEHLHAGHRKLLETAFSIGGKVYIGLSTDEFASKGRERDVLPYEVRRKNLMKYLESMGYEDYDIEPLDDRVGRCLEKECSELVVSEETEAVASEINRTRSALGLPQMRVHVVPYVLADDFRPISSTRIHAGEIDEDGRLKRPLKVAVGSVNPNKVEAVRSVLSEFYDDVVVQGIGVDPGVPEQPFNEDTVKGAMNRARKALKGWEDADLGVGIEAGLVLERTTGRYYDVQYCAIMDRTGWVTVGHGPGFYYPKKVMSRVSEGISIGDAMKVAYGEGDIGYRQGAIGFLTKGHYDRKRLSENAVMMAFVPRIKKEDYREEV